ncbi:hypothetical protein ABVF47_003130 [Snodgrassella alvi]|uniref:hypothetical protein n=1 Tax=Snodgrassella alvi TaxID=1196083 RepID=UPI00352FBEB0
MHHSTPPPIGGEGAGGAIAGAKSRFAGKTAPFTAPLVVHWWCKSHKLLFYMDFNCTTYCTTSGAPPPQPCNFGATAPLTAPLHHLVVQRVHTSPLRCHVNATKRELPTVLCALLNQLSFLYTVALPPSYTTNQVVTL